MKWVLWNITSVFRLPSTLNFECATKWENEATVVALKYRDIQEKYVKTLNMVLYTS